MKHLKATERLAAGYMKALVAHPNNTVWANMEIAVLGSPVIASAYETDALNAELLAALEQSMFMIEGYEGTSDENDKIVDAARAAIAKAKGE